MSELLWILFDLVLATMSLGLAWAAVETRDLRRGVVLFIALGLLLAIVWARLQASDLALAEAAIGAGIAGALLLAALRDEIKTNVEADTVAELPRWLINVGTVALFAMVTWGLLYAFSISDGVRLAATAQAHIPDSGVTNPVTSVLLNFRAYDTLLELAVVFTAVLGVLSLGPARRGFQPANPVLSGLVRWLVPLLIMMAGYLLWVGAHAPGGAFQAGAVLAAAAILLRLSGLQRAGLPGNRAIRWLLVIGIGVFTLVGLLVMPGERAFLQYPGEFAGVLILLIEAAATLSIAVALTVAYTGGRPADWEEVSARESESGIDPSASNSSTTGVQH